jgi:hypothetical protein
MNQETGVQLKIPLNIDVFTSATAARIIKTIVEYLAFHRNQIPSSFESYKFIVERLKNSLVNDDGEWSSCLQNKSKKEAITTLEKLEELKNVCMT